jgi:hypothetical protein
VNHDVLAVVVADATVVATVITIIIVAGVDAVINVK